MTQKFDWFDYWNQEDKPMLDDMRKNKDIFLKNSARYFSFRRGDVVLDIGCGPGYLEEYLKDKVKEIYCLETSEYFFKILRRKFYNSPNIHIYKLDETEYLNLNFLKHKRFTVALCMGVVPYYNDVLDFKKLILQVQKYCKGGLFLIADIKVSINILDDLLGLLKMGFKENYLLKLTAFLVNARFSSYYKAYRKNGLLVIPETEIRKMIKEMKLSAKIINEPFSLNSQRKHLLIKF